MPNLGALLKTEIARLSRREIKKQIEGTVKTSAQHRRHIAQLRRQITSLEREIADVRRQLNSKARSAGDGESGPPLRFVAKGFRSHRSRLGLSASELGRLLGVSAQSIYNWERQVSVPRKEQLKRIAALRSWGKREARVRLAELEQA